MTRTAPEIETALKSAGLRMMVALDMQGKGVVLYRSLADPRIIMRVETPKGGTGVRTFEFSDDAVEIDVSEVGPIILDEPRTFKTLGDLCVAIAAHEAILHREHQWRDAAPSISTEQGEHT